MSMWRLVLLGAGAAPLAHAAKMHHWTSPNVPKLGKTLWLATQLECHALAGGGRSENAPDMVPWLFIHGLQALVKAVPTAQVNAQGAPVMGRLWHFKVKNVKNALGESRL